MKYTTLLLLITAIIFITSPRTLSASTQVLSIQDRTGEDYVENDSESALEVTVRPVFYSPWKVGLTASWKPIAEAESYRVTSTYESACGSGSEVNTTTKNISLIEPVYNCAAPFACMERVTAVEALDDVGAVIERGEASLCQTGAYGEGAPLYKEGEMDTNTEMTKILKDARYTLDLILKYITR